MVVIRVVGFGLATLKVANQSARIKQMEEEASRK
jgi:hypothetical protein